MRRLISPSNLFDALLSPVNISGYTEHFESFERIFMLVSREFNYTTDLIEHLWELFVKRDKSEGFDSFDFSVRTFIWKATEANLEPSKYGLLIGLLILVFLK